MQTISDHFLLEILGKSRSFKFLILQSLHCAKLTTNYITTNLAGKTLFCLYKKKGGGGGGGGFWGVTPGVAL